MKTIISIITTRSQKLANRWKRSTATSTRGNKRSARSSPRTWTAAPDRPAIPINVAEEAVADARGDVEDEVEAAGAVGVEVGKYRRAI
jgi:hypothetical protein